MRWLAVVTMATTIAAVSALSGMSSGVRATFGGRSAGTIAPAQRNCDREYRGIERDRSQRRPIDKPQGGGNRKPQHGRQAETQRQTMPLRQHRVAQRKYRNRGVGREAADGTRGDEGRRVFDGEDDVGGARRRRQRSDQRADERPAAFDRDRGDNHDRCRHRHLEREFEPEQEFGGDHAHSHCHAHEGGHPVSIAVRNCYDSEDTGSSAFQAV